jgi:hypothetical protein
LDKGLGWMPTYRRAGEADPAKMTRQKRLNVIITTFADSDMIIRDDIRTVDSQIEIKLIEIDQVIIKKNIKGGWSF